MKILRIRAIARKEFLQIRRDFLSLAIAFLMPIIQLFIYGYAITFDVTNIATVVYDQDKSRLSRQFIEEFSATDYFRLKGYVSNQEAIDHALDSGAARVAFMIPPDFSEHVAAGEPAQIGVMLDGADANTATITQGYIAAISQQFNRNLAERPVPVLVEPRVRVWYNPELESRNFIVPGLIAIIMAVIVALLTSLTIAREWERGTMEQFIATPVKISELILGKLVPYFMIGFIDLGIVLFIGVFVFQVPLRGNLSLLLGLSSIFLFGGICQGMVISTVARGSQMVASQIALLSTFLPAFLLSGFVFPIDNMPLFFQWLTYLIPARYFVTVLQDIFLKGNPLRLLLFQASLLIVYASVTFLIANVRFHKRIE